eukprot:8661989-Pyramimonas_sp.AAC.1
MGDVGFNERLPNARWSKSPDARVAATGGTCTRRSPKTGCTSVAVKGAAGCSKVAGASMQMAFQHEGPSRP